MWLKRRWRNSPTGEWTWHYLSGSEVEVAREAAGILSDIELDSEFGQELEHELVDRAPRDVLREKLAEAQKSLDHILAIMVDLRIEDRYASLEGKASDEA